MLRVNEDKYSTLCDSIFFVILSFYYKVTTVYISTKTSDLRMVLWYLLKIKTYTSRDSLVLNTEFWKQSIWENRKSEFC